MDVEEGLIARSDTSGSEQLRRSKGEVEEEEEEKEEKKKKVSQKPRGTQCPCQ